jgi:hypothetical protein
MQYYNPPIFIVKYYVYRLLLVPCYNLFVYLFSLVSSKPEVMTDASSPIPVQAITTTSLTEQYIQRQATRLLNTYNINDNRLTYNENIDAIFYSKPEWTELLKDENNYLEKKWRTKILIENTPRGNIIMHYDAYKLAFAYYSDQTVPYQVLNAVAMKYVLTFFCRDFFMDETVRTPERGTSVGVRGLSGDGLPSKDNVLPETNISKITTKHKEYADVEKAKIQKEKENDNANGHGTKSWRFESKENETPSNTKSPFAKFKSYNNVSAKSTNISNTSNTSNTVKNGGTKEITLTEPKQTNRFVYLGKTRNVSLLQKPEIIKDNENTILSNSKIYTTESGSLQQSGIYSIFSPSSTVADYSFEQKTQESVRTPEQYRSEDAREITRADVSSNVITYTSSLPLANQPQKPKPKQQMTYAEYKRLLQENQ